MNNSHGFNIFPTIHRFTQIWNQEIFILEKVQFHWFGVEPFLYDR